MTSYIIAGETVDSEAPVFQQKLADALAAQIRPLCACNEERAKQPMVIAHHTHQGSTRFILRRLPEAGKLHASHCQHFEGIKGLVAFEDLAAGAIRKNPDTDQATLRLGFPLIQAEQRRFATSRDPEQTSSKRPPAPTGLKPLGLLHYMWASSELVRMSGALQTRRNWAVVRNRLLACIMKLGTARHELAPLVFIPQIFELEQKARLESAFRMRLNHASSHREAVLLIGEVKSVENLAVTIKHLPFVQFRADETCRAHLASAWEEVGARQQACAEARVVALLVLMVSRDGVCLIRSLDLMTVTRHWIPFASVAQFELLTVLDQGRRDYDRLLDAGSQTLADVLLIDTGDRGTACLIHPSQMPESQASLLAELQREHQPVWQWNLDEAMPPLPLRAAWRHHAP